MTTNKTDNALALVIGKFCPLHKGHESLISFAKNLFKNVRVLVDHYEKEEFSCETRQTWIKELFPSPTLEVYSPKHFMPQFPEEPNFWEKWAEELLKQSNEITHVVGSEPYITKVAKIIGAIPVFYDTERKVIPFRASTIKRNILHHWDELTLPVKKQLQRRVLIMGAECSGKTTLAANLSRSLNGSLVPEYVALQLKNGRELTYNLLKEAIQGQAMLEKTIASEGNPYIICDSDYLTTHIYAELLYKKTLPIPEPATKTPDLVILCKPLSWVNDSHRLGEKINRNIYHTMCSREILKHRWNFVEVERIEDISNVEKACRDIFKTTL